jgi:hypothetical protein
LPSRRLGDESELVAVRPGLGVVAPGAQPAQAPLRRGLETQ